MTMRVSPMLPVLATLAVLNAPFAAGPLTPASRGATVQADECVQQAPVTTAPAASAGAVKWPWCAGD
jgi:hypothetical protein